MWTTHLPGVKEVLALVETHALLLQFSSRASGTIVDRQTDWKVIRGLVCWNSVISMNSIL